jgi:sulfatase maturation enzyme AslB (radical SAM superfamily)
VSIPSKVFLGGECSVILRLDADLGLEDIADLKQTYGARLTDFQLTADLLCQPRLLKALDQSRVIVIPSARLPRLDSILSKDHWRNLQLSVLLFPDQHLLGNINIITSLGIPLRLDAAVAATAGKTLVRAVDFYLHNPLLTMPVEPFHALLRHLACGKGPSLWQTQGERVADCFYVGDDSTVTLSKRWFDQGLLYGSLDQSWEMIVNSNLFQKLSDYRRELFRTGQQCIYCQELPLCGGYLKAADPEQPCEQWQQAFRALRKAVHTATNLDESQVTARSEKMVFSSPDIIQLEKDGRLLLMDGKAIQPLLIQDEIEKVRGYLTRCKDGAIPEAFLRNGDYYLFQTLVEHGLLRYENGNGRNTACRSEGCGRHRPPTGGSREGRFQGKNELSMYLLLTQYCNLSCIYCLNGVESYKKRSLPRMGDRVAFQAAETQLEALAPNGTLRVVFFGGEPLLNWPLAKRFITYCETELKEKHRDKKYCIILLQILHCFRRI